MRIRPRRQAPLALFAFALTFVLIQIAFHYPVARWFPQVRDVEYGKKITRLRTIAAEKPPDRPLVVAFGSSLTAMGFCPGAIADSEPGSPVCYNFAINSCGVVVQLMCINRLLEEGIRPDVALIELSPYFLTREKNLVNDGEFLPADRVQARDFQILDRYRPEPDQFRTEWARQQCLPWWSHRRTLQNWVAPQSVPRSRRIDNLWSRTDLWGWEHMPELIEIHALYYLYPGPCRALREYWRMLTAAPFDPQMAAAVQEIVGVCRKNGIRPVLLLVPESSLLRESHDPEGKRRFEDYVTRLKNQGADVVDARDWLTDPEFIEGLHPNPGGSHAYTSRLNREFLSRVAKHR